MIKDKTNWDISKKEFYDLVRERKDELKEVMAHMTEPWQTFDLWYTGNWDWRFLRDIYGNREKKGLPWDYLNLLHLPRVACKEVITGGTIDTEKAMKGLLKPGSNIDILYLIEDGIPTFTINASLDSPLTQSDWAETDTTALSYIKNKPTIPSKTTELINDSGFITLNALTPYAKKTDIDEETARATAAEATKLDKSTTVVSIPYAYTHTSEGDSIMQIDDAATASSIARRTLDGNINVATTPTYAAHATSKDYVDKAVATSTARFLGTYIGGTVRPSPEWTTDQYTDFLIAQTSARGLTPTNNDYAFVEWSEVGQYDRCKFDAAMVKWEFEYTIIGKQAINQSDWVETDTSSPAFIKNKPNLSVYEHVEHKTTTIDSSSTDIQYPTAKAVYDVLEQAKRQSSIHESTYFELQALMFNRGLIPGHWYRITDYVATTTQVLTQSANHPFDIIVLATSDCTLSEEARAIQHDGDTYFANSNLSAWKVGYCFSNDTERFAWANANGKGVVYHLIDEFQNEAWYDFKGIQVKNAKGSTDRFYYLFDKDGADSSLSDTTTYPTVHSNKFGPYIESNKHKIGCNVFKGNIIWNNTFGNSCYNNTTGNNFTGNMIGSYFHDNAIGNLCSNNLIDDSFYNNTIGPNFKSNTIGNQFNSNTIGTGFNGNTIGNYTVSNTIGDSFYSNDIGNNFANNTTGTNFKYNTIGTYFYGNIIGDTFSDNTIGGSFSNNNTTSLASQPSGCTFPSSVEALITTSTTLTRLSKATYYIGSANSLKTLD